MHFSLSTMGPEESKLPNMGPECMSRCRVVTIEINLASKFIYICTRESDLSVNELINLIFSMLRFTTIIFSMAVIKI